MGSMISATCKCGFQRELMMGGGMRSFNKLCVFPAYCEECDNFIEVNLLKKDVQCPFCNSTKIIPYDDERLIKSRGRRVTSWDMAHKIGRILELTDGKYYCHQCKEYGLSFQEIGCWD